MMAATTPRKKPKKSLDALLDGAKRPETSVSLCLRADLQADYEQLERDLAEANKDRNRRLAGNPEAQRILAEMESMRGEMLDATVEFRLRALSRRSWVDLKKAHPSTDPKFEFDVDPFVAALIAACCIEPEVTSEQWERLIGDDGTLTDIQYEKISNAAWNLNRQDPRVPFSHLASTLTSSSDATSRPQSA